MSEVTNARQPMEIRQYLFTNADGTEKSANQAWKEYQADGGELGFKDWLNSIKGTYQYADGPKDTKKTNTLIYATIGVGILLLSYGIYQAYKNTN